MNVPQCGAASAPVRSEEAGMHVLHYEWLEGHYSQEIEAPVAGAGLTIAGRWFNERAVVRAHITDPSGSKLGEEFIISIHCCA